MTRIFLSIAAVAMLSSTALAADLAPQAAEPVVPVTPYSWTGLYLGANIGGAWNNSKWSDFGGPGFKTNGNGFIYGGQIGYNYQFDGGFVVGLEGDFTGSTVKGDSQCSNAAGTSCRTKQDWLASIRARAGYAFDRILVYGTGGVAFSDYKFEQTVAIHQSWDGGSRTGWTAGLGIEYAFTDHITAGVEWKYYDFGKKTGRGGGGPTSIKFKETENTVIAKINYKFDPESFF